MGQAGQWQWKGRKQIAMVRMVEGWQLESYVISSRDGTGCMVMQRGRDGET